MRTDFDQIEEGAQIVLHPRVGNPLHDEPVMARFAGGYFYCDGTDPADGPDYYMGDVLTYNSGYSEAPND